MKSTKIKKSVLKTTLAALAASSFLFGATSLHSQPSPPSGFPDPAEMRQRMLERMREQFEMQDNAEWKMIAARIQKVLEAREALRSLSGSGGFGFMGPPPGLPPGGRDQAGPRPDDAPGSPGGAPPDGPPPGGTDSSAPPRGPGGARGMNQPESPETQELRRAVEAKASSAELKAKLAALRSARQKQEAELAKARNDLREILTMRQEAVALMNGLLN